MSNRDRYEDVYPSDSEDDDDTDEDSDTDDEIEDVKRLKEKDEELSQKLKRAQECKSSASGRLNILENYGKSVEKDRPNEIQDCLSNYENERKKAFDAFNTSEFDITKLNEERAKLRKQQIKAKNKANKEKAKANKEKEKEKEKKRRAMASKLQAKRQVKIDRVKFWPRKVYKVVVSLDAMSEMTPGSSRRGSISSVGKSGLESAASDACQIALSISYITNWASWAPRYDLSLNTPTRSGTITYRAEFCNSTSETWKDAKVILSTSETAFQGLGEPIPTMQPWHIRLAKYALTTTETGALYSGHEQRFKASSASSTNTKSIQQPRDALFGLDGIDAEMQQLLIQQQQKGQAFPLQQQPQLRIHQSRGFVDSTHTKGLFGSSAAKPPAPSGAGFGNNISSSFGAPSYPQERDRQPQAIMAYQNPRAAPVPPAASYDEEGSVSSIADNETMIPDLPSLATQESSWAESGLTATYDIPGLRTISPSYTMRRHKIASIHLKDIHLSYLLVPKLRVAAFLKARLRNNSSIALLRGPAGLTLDGSFLGNTNIPRCSAGESFSLSLGVDPSVNVTYGKPTVRRSQSGIINKEGSGIYTRTCTVTNTKSNRAIEGLVIDQIPVSEDERLRVEILQPRGLRHENDTVRSGVGFNNAGKDDLKWGKASAIVKKAGEICWDFRIEAGKGGKFVLEYEARYPSGEMVVGV